MPFRVDFSGWRGVCDGEFRRWADGRLAPVWVTLLGVGVGTLLGGVISALTSRYAAFKEAKGIAAALRAEIDSILLMISKRRYIEGLTEVIARLTDPAHILTLADIPSISVTQDYFSVFHATASKIGMLGELSGPITRLYVFGKGLIEDLDTLREWQKKHAPLTKRELHEALEAVRFLFETLETEGAVVMARLDKFASNRNRWLYLFP
jgi:hypothetical protein